MNTILRVVLVTLLASSSFVASANPLRWDLVDVTSLGTSITGSFVYNADTNAYGSIDITTTGGTVIPSETWTNKATFGTFNGYLALVDTAAPDETGANLLNLIFNSITLTDAGGTIPIASTQQGTCNVSDCAGFDPYATDPTGGTNDNVTGDIVAAVPEPATLALLSLGLAGLGFARRNRKN